LFIHEESFHAGKPERKDSLFNPMQILSLLGHTQELLALILKSNRPADSLIDTFFRSRKYLGSHDRRFIAETTYSTLRHLRKCEHYVASSLAGVCDNLLEEDRILLLIVASMSIEEKKLDVTPDELSGKLKGPQLKGKVAFLLTNLLESPTVAAGTVVQKIGIEYSFPDWMVERFIQQYGESETEKICSSLNEQAPLTLRVNTLKASVEQCQEELRKQGIETTRTSLSPVGLTIAKRMNVFSLAIFRDGWFEVQDEGSQLLPLILDPKPNAKVLDVCAGAGGKTLEMAALMKNRGEIFATDINAYRLEELRKRTKRAGVQNVRVQEIKTVEDLRERYHAFFDIVFVDAPCSGLGTIRRNPGMKWMVTDQTVQEVSEKQKTILQSSIPLVKPEGLLVYATCTLLRQENEAVIEALLAQHPEFTIVPLDSKLPPLQKTGRTDADSFLKLFPHIHGTDGFFCAVLRKRKVR
jgi:16S rRNA (cytosine967-C5)-methyltransferase